MKCNQSGFTLIEIAIVLVIIGLLLGSILKGQELINSAKVKNLATDLKNIPVFIYGFQDKYKALPGDDSTVTSHLAGATACTPAAAGLCAPGNGTIDGAWNATAITSESFLFWQHVRLAGLAPGPTDTAAGDYRPKNAVGGYIGITNAANAPITGLKGSYIICTDAIAGKFAKQLDTTLDDGNTTTGSMQAVATGTAAPTAAHSIIPSEDDIPFLVCMGF